MLRILFALPGLHRVHRGAEVAFESLAAELASRPDCRVTLIGSGQALPDRPYRFIHAPCLSRRHFDRWPHLPLLRDAYMIEDLTFAPGLWRAYRPRDYDLTVTCSYPYTSWILRSGRRNGRQPMHVFVTQNSDWPARRIGVEYRLFHCDTLVCTNPEYHLRHQRTWRCVTIPNGVDLDHFAPGDADREAFGLPDNVPVVLMVSALIAEKRVLDAIDVVARLPEAHLVVAGDGPLRDRFDALAAARLPGRSRRITCPASSMPALYRTADCVLHMSMDEPFGNVFVEALATGLPIVTHDRPATRWILGDDAVRVDTTDASATAGALAGALSLNTPEHQARRRARARRRFAWRHVADHYHAFFTELTQQQTWHCIA